MITSHRSNLIGSLGRLAQIHALALGRSQREHISRFFFRAATSPESCMDLLFVCVIGTYGRLSMLREDNDYSWFDSLIEGTMQASMRTSTAQANRPLFMMSFRSRL